MLSDLGNLLIVILVAWMLGEFVASKTAEFVAKRKIWWQFVAMGMEEEDAKRIVKGFLVNKEAQKK